MQEAKKFNGLRNDSLRANLSSLAGIRLFWTNPRRKIDALPPRRNRDRPQPA